MLAENVLVGVAKIQLVLAAVGADSLPNRPIFGGLCGRRSRSVPIPGHVRKLLFHEFIAGRGEREISKYLGRVTG